MVPIAHVTDEEDGWLHDWSGYAIAAIVVARVIRGFDGTEHARFRDFVFAPARVAGDIVPSAGRHTFSPVRPSVS